MKVRKKCNLWKAAAAACAVAGCAFLFHSPDYAPGMSRVAAAEGLADETTMQYLVEKWKKRENPIDLRGWEVTSDDYNALQFQAQKRYPELYYLGTSSYYRDSDGYITELTMTYGSDRDAELEAEAAKVIALVDDTMSDLEKAIVVHDYMCADITYKEYNKEAHNSIGAILNKEAVCEGYAEAYKYYLDRVGVQCKVIGGYGYGIGHAWNQVKIGEEWYQVDPTWGDTDSTYGSGIKHDYFLRSADSFPNHTWTKEWYDPCNDTSYDNAFWCNLETKSPIYAGGGYLYWLGSDGIYRHSVDKAGIGEPGSLWIPINDRWTLYTGSGGSGYSSVAYKDGYLYYSTPKTVYACSLSGGERTTVLTLGEETAEQIWKLEIKGGTLYYQTGEGLYAEKTERSVVIDPDYQKSEYPISIQSPAVTVTYGADYYLNSYAPGRITYTTSDPGVCTVNSSGGISPVSCGKAEITLRTAGTDLYLPGEKVIQVEVVPKDISSGYLTLSGYTFAYNGKAQEPGVTVMAEWGHEVPEDQYTVSYQDNVYPGTAKVLVTADGEHYTGTLSATFTVEKGSEPVPDAAYRASLAGYRLSLAGNIGVKFYMELGSAVAGSSTSCMRFTLPDGTMEDVPVAEAEIDSSTLAGKTCYVFTCEVAAKEMTAEVRAQMMYDGKPAGTEYTYSAKQYADYILGNQTQNTEYAQAAGLVKSMLNYGSYAQKYFGYRTDDLANSSSYITEADKSVAAVTAEMLEPYKNQAAQKNEIVKFEGTNLSLLSETTLRLYFTIADGTDPESVSFRHDGKTLEKVRSGNYYYVEIQDIAAQNLDIPCEVTVTCGDAAMPVTYSVMAYCYNVLSRPAEGGRTQELKDVIAALYLYNQQAKGYLGN